MNIKSVLFFVVALLFCSIAIHAQVQTGQPQSTQQGSTSLTASPTSEMTQINTSALPDPLRNTLQSDQQFKGWQNGQWYFNSTTNQYSVQMPGNNQGSASLPANPAITSAPANPLGSVNPTTANPVQGYSTSPMAYPQSPQSLPVNPISTNPTGTSAPTTPVSSANPLGTTPATSMQLPSSQPVPSGTTVTWYQFDANGKLIPQPPRDK